MAEGFFALPGFMLLKLGRRGDKIAAQGHCCVPNAVCLCQCCTECISKDKDFVCVARNPRHVSFSVSHHSEATYAVSCDSQKSQAEKLVFVWGFEA